MRTLAEHFAQRTLYRYMDDLRELGLLSWQREKHYHQRKYWILIPQNHLPDEGETPATLGANHLPDEPNHLPDEHKTPAIATPYIRLLPSEEPSKKEAKPQTPSPSSKDSNPELLKNSRLWLASTWVGLNLTTKQRNEVGAAPTIWRSTRKPPTKSLMT